MGQLLKIENLSVSYEKAAETVALRDISFSIAAGERVAIVGANGAGKSTLLLSLVGILPPAQGSITLGENHVLSKTSHSKETLQYFRRQIGLVFQNPEDQIFMPSVRDDILFGPLNDGQKEEEIDPRLNEILKRLGIAHLKNRMAHKLSDGEKRKVALAGVLVMEPAILLLDEPTSFLDHRARRSLLSILDRLPQTLILVTHNMELAARLCTRVLVLKEGQIFADGEPKKLLTDDTLMETCGL
jgi:cobalt/nickel transport system ATP-binding protein